MATPLDALFAGYEPEPRPDKDPDLSDGRRLTLRQSTDIRAGRHPLTRGPLHAQASRGATKHDGAKQPYTCGTCTHREVLGHHSRGYPKCVAHNGIYVKHSATSDVRAWWPACTTYQPTEEPT